MIVQRLQADALLQHPELLTQLVEADESATVVIQRRGEQITIVQNRRDEAVESLLAESDRLLACEPPRSRSEAFADLRSILAEIQQTSSPS